MKKNSIILILSSALLLSACGGRSSGSSTSSGDSSSNSQSSSSSSSSSSLISSGAKDVELSKATDCLSSAATAMGSLDSFGLSLVSPSNVIKADINIGTTIIANSSSQSTQIKNYKVDASAKDIKLDINAKGLQSKTVSDFKASATMSGSVNGSITIPSSTEGMSNSVNFDYSSMSVAAYIKDGAAYADLSSKSFMNFAATIYSLSSSKSSSSSEGFPIDPGKYTSGAGLVSESMLPLLSDDFKAAITMAASVIASYASEYSSFIKSYSYDNGDYALSLSLTNKNIASFINKIVSSASSSSSSSVSSTTSIFEVYASFFDISSCEMAIVYNKEGLVSFEDNIDVSLNTTLGDVSDKLVSTGVITSSAAVPNEYRATKESLSVASSSKMSFLTGDKVVVSYPADLDTYESLGEGSSSSSSAK